MQQEVFPRICGDLLAGVLPSGLLHDPCGVTTARPAKELLCSFTVVAAADDTPRKQRQLALLAARLLSACAAAAPPPTAREWYWAQAIDLLDRLCEVGLPCTRAGLTSARIEKLLSGQALASESVWHLPQTLRWLAHALALGFGSATASANTLVPGTAPRLPPLAAEAGHDNIVLPGA